MFQSLQSDLSSIVLKFKKKRMHIFQFSHIAASSALLHHTRFFSPWLQHFGKFYNYNLKFPFQDDLDFSPDKTWNLIPSPLFVCRVTSRESLYLSNLWFAFWKIESTILLTPCWDVNMVCLNSWYSTWHAWSWIHVLFPLPDTLQNTLPIMWVSCPSC